MTYCTVEKPEGGLEFLVVYKTHKIQIIIGFIKKLTRKTQNLSQIGDIR